MRFFNFRFSQRNGVSFANWFSPTLGTWQQQGLPFIDFGTRVDFCQTLPDYFAFKFRIANCKLTFHFNFNGIRTRLIVPNDSTS